MKKLILALSLLVVPLQATLSDEISSNRYLRKGMINFVGDDYKKAVHYFALAGIKGSHEGLYWYAYCAEFGLGCTKNLPRALMYYTLAKRMGNAKAVARMENVEDVIY